MKTKKVIRLPQMIVGVLLLAILFTPWFLSSSTAQDEMAFDSPLPTLPVPTPAPQPSPSTEAQIALRYVAERYDIPVGQLVIANEHRREYAESGRAFKAFTLLELQGDRRFFKLMVDLENHAVVKDVAAIEQAEEDAYRKKYGKLEPTLYERLQKAADDELVKVAIWVAGRPRRSQEEILAELAARFPEAQAVLERSGKPFDVQDAKVRTRIELAYTEMLEADTQPRVQPIVNYLQTRGYAVTTYGSLPSITAVLPKRVVLVVAERPDVGRIFLTEGEGQFRLDSAVPADRVPIVWQRGFDGTGRSIAIVEPDNVDFTSNSADCPAGTDNCFRHPGETRAGVDPAYYHASLVASAAASDHPTHKGVAPGATIHSAGMSDFDGSALIEALQWSLKPDDPSTPGVVEGVSADVINISYGFEPEEPEDDWLAWAVDHWAHHYWRMIVVAVANTSSPSGHCMGTPEKAWNVVSVGAYDNQDTSEWSDDEMADFSCYANPSGDREKPEVVAPGVEIVGIKRDGILETDPLYNTGTSFATPQVAGLAALLVDRKSALATWPEASRAIIMASAVHNIEGPSDVPTGQDLKDGAGAIDAALADTVAKTRWTSATTPCSDPCWWGLYITNTSFPVDTYLHRYFKASRGERIRIAISWWSNVDCADENHCNYDQLDTDLNLAVWDPNGNPVPDTYSASWDNNYELVEFTAPKTGKYTIAVYKGRADEDSNFLGIAWVKTATYLPDVKSGYNGWDSDITVRNDGAQPKDVTVMLFNANGSYAGEKTHYGLQPHAALTYDPPHTGFSGSAIVSASEDVSAVVEHSSSVANTSSAGNPAPAASAYLPTLVVRNNRQAWVYLQNASPTSATIRLRFYNRSGSLVHTRYETIPANGRTALHLNAISQVFNGFGQTSGCGSLFAETTNGTDIVVSTQIDYPDAAYAYGGPSAGDTTLWTPGVFRRVSGGIWQLYSAVNVQNLGSSTANIHVRFIDRSGNVTYEFDQSVPAKSAVAYNTRHQGTTPSGIWNPLIAALGDSWSGSVCVTSANHSLAGVNLYFPASYGPDIIATPLTGQGQSTAGVLTAPAVYRQKPGGTWTRWSAILVQNTSDTTQATITVRFFDSNGSQVGAIDGYDVAIDPSAYAALNLKAGVDLPQAALNALDAWDTNFAGSMTVTSDGHEILGVTYTFEESTDHHAGYPLLAAP